MLSGKSSLRKSMKLIQENRVENRTVSEDEARSTARVVGLVAHTAIRPTRLPRLCLDIERQFQFEGHRSVYPLYHCQNQVHYRQVQENGVVCLYVVEKKTLPALKFGVVLMCLESTDITRFWKTALRRQRLKICQYIYESCQCLHAFIMITRFCRGDSCGRRA